MKRSKIKYMICSIIILIVFLEIVLVNKDKECSIYKPIEDIKIINGTDLNIIPEISKSRKDTLIIGTKYDYKVLNPIYSNSNYEEIINSLIFSGLMNNKEDGTMELNLLKRSPEILDDGNKYKFTLKDNIKWSDGKEITTDDVEFTYKILFDKSYNGLANRNILKIIGSDEYRKGTENYIKGIKKIDKKNIEISVENGNALTLRFLNIVPMPKHIYEDKYKQGDTSYIELTNENPKVFSGPYKISKINSKSIELIANDNFSGKKPIIKNIEIKKLEEDFIEELKNGYIDMIDIAIDEQNINKVKELGFVDIYHYPNNGYGYIGLNLIDNPKMQDVNIRKALTYALDRKNIVKELFGEYGEVINIPQSKLSWVYTDEEIEKYDYNKEKAINLIEESGYTKNSHGIFQKNNEVLEVKFLKTRNNKINNIITKYAKENYENIGIKFTIEDVDFEILRKILNDKKEGKTTKNYDMFFMAWALNSDPDCTTIFSKDGIQNRTGYYNEEVDKLIKKGLEEFNEVNRINIYQELYKNLNNDIPYIYLYGRRDGIAVSSKIKGINVSPYRSFTYDIDKVYIESEK